MLLFRAGREARQSGGAKMVRLYAAHGERAALYAEMRALGLHARRPYSAMVLGIVAAADTASAVFMLSAL